MSGGLAAGLLVVHGWRHWLLGTNKLVVRLLLLRLRLVGGLLRGIKGGSLLLLWFDGHLHGGHGGGSGVEVRLMRLLWLENRLLLLLMRLLLVLILWRVMRHKGSARLTACTAAD